MSRESGAIYWAIEGIGGAGKSTQLQYLKDYLEVLGRKVVYVREPGGVKEAESIRELIFRLKKEGAVNVHHEVALFMAARYFLMKQILEPVLDSGSDVASDRTAASTGAYQGFGGRAGLESIGKIAKAVLGNYLPDEMILLNLSYKEGMKRKKDKHEGDPYDGLGRKYWERVEQGYREMAREKWLGMDWRVIDASKKVEEVRVDIQNVVNQVLRA